MTDRIRVTLDDSPEFQALLAELKRKAVSVDPADVIRRAIQIFDAEVDAKQAELDRYYRDCEWCGFPIGKAAKGHFGCTGRWGQEACGLAFDHGRLMEIVRTGMERGFCILCENIGCMGYGCGPLVRPDPPTR